MKISFDNQYVTLGDEFFKKCEPIAVANPALIKFNEVLAGDLGIEFVSANESDIAAIFSGNTLAKGANPVAMAYAGHQFGHFVPQLGDGRAVLLGELMANNGVRYGLHFKGSGQTYFSRNGDGRAALGPVLREYLVSEAMAKFNIPTTRALAAVATGEEVARERLLPGGVITRVATSFVRVGTFEYFRAREDVDSIRKLADYVIEQNYPSISGSDNHYVSLLKAVVERQALLIAQWMGVGFIHGVMNTDNMSIAGETIDYGPCAFMDEYQHDKVFSSIDRQGRYAYSNQPSIALWNLTRLAECLIPLFSDNTDTAIDIAKDVLESFIKAYESHWLAGMRTKCGLTAIAGCEQEDKVLIESLFDIMSNNNADFTLTFTHLSTLKEKADETDNSCRELFDGAEQFDKWLEQWRKRLSQETQGDKERHTQMQAVNPVYIPRNHLIEAAIRAAEDRSDFSLFHSLHDVLENPFELQNGKERFQLPPEPDEVVEKTFCGT